MGSCHHHHHAEKNNKRRNYSARDSVGWHTVSFKKVYDIVTNLVDLINGNEERCDTHHNIIDIPAVPETPIYDVRYKFPDTNQIDDCIFGGTFLYSTRFYMMSL